VREGVAAVARGKVVRIEKRGGDMEVVVVVTVVSVCVMIVNRGTWW